MDFSSLVSEEKIKKAYQDGAFEKLPGYGKPLPKDSLESIPEELRMAARILKNAGYSVEENKIKHELLTIEDLMKSSGEEERNTLQKKYTEKLIRYHQLMKKRMEKSHSKNMRLYQEKIEERLRK
ncbi:MAG TPA: DUF1992 domain-containing protein [Niallia sp.]|nr:DUF1992 domain-containing protein [Niallia sp.]